MRRKKLLVAILLVASFCFVVSGVGYGKVAEWGYESKTSYLESDFLRARIGYMMRNPTNFFGCDFYYDSTGAMFSGEFPKPIDTKEKIAVMKTDIVAILYSSEDIPLAYFCQGEYHLWED